jgi:ankyrin repeat protein
VDLALQYAINSEMMKEFSSYDPTARARYVQILRELVQAGADVNQPTSKVPPLTLAAAYGGDAEMVRLLLELGADPKAHADIRLATALHAAAAYGHTEIARVLLDAGADVNALAPQNKTPLDEAIQNERVGVAELLRHAGGREGVAGEHPSLSSVSANLLAAARTGDVADVREALQAGADVNAKDDVAYRQLEAGTPDTEVTGGKPAVLLATERGELPMVQELLSAGADPNTFSTCTMFYPGRTALHAAAERGDLAVVEAIIRAGGDVNAKELGESETWVEMPLHLAAERGHIEVVRALLAAKAKVDGKTNRGTALHAATRGGQVEVLRLLLQAGAKLEISAKLEGTPLMTAGTEGYPEIARLLLEAGADVHAEAHGQTPLHIVVYAVWWRSDWKEEKRRSAEMIETIRLLIKHGADVNARDREGQTPMDMAEQYELKEVIALLTAAGAKRATDLEAGPQHGAAADREKPARKPNR